MSKILITGGSGFIGTNLVKHWAKTIQRCLEVRSIKEMPLSIFKILALIGDVLSLLGYNNFPMSSFRLKNMMTEMIHDTSKLESYCGEIQYSIEKGMKITDRCLVGAKSLVNKDLSVPGLYVGSPIRLIRKF